MAEHKYPAELSADDAADIERDTAAYRHMRVQAVVARNELRRQNAQLSASLNAERAKNEATKTELESAIKAYEYERQIRMAVMQRRDRNRAWARAWKRAAKRYLGAFESACAVKGGSLERAIAGLDEAMRLREGFMRQIAFIEQERDQACAELAAERAAHEATKRERDGRKEQQFISETAVLNAYVQAFPSYGYESTPQAMQVFLSELATARARADAAEHMLAIVREERDRYGKAVLRAADDYMALERQLGEAQSALALSDAAAGVSE